MATNTYVALTTTTLSTSASSITVSGIPQGYTDLEIKVYAKTGPTAGNSSSYLLTFNGDTSNNYGTTFAYGINTSVGTGRYSNQAKTYVGRVSSNAFSTSEIIINQYSNPNIYKTILSKGYDPYGYIIMFADLWFKSTKEAITSFTLSDEGLQNFDAGTTVTVYGIASADIVAKATGGIITEDATYTYHTFGASGTFTPKQSLTADILVVAGGGGGGGGGSTWANGGGGGAGGVAYYASQSLTTTGYTCTVGGPGAGGIAYTKGTSGVNSSFGGLTAAVGGGAGGGYSDGRASTGGSGGGGAGLANSGNTGAAGTAGQGNAGGNGFNSASNTGNGGGGGGAGGIGQAANVRGSTFGGNGGAGTNTYSSWILTTGLTSDGYIAGGGGGGAGTSGNYGIGTAGAGNGGGGNVNGTNALAYTGSGGGGCGAAGSGGGTIGGNGGSGVIIIRYPK